MLASDKVGGRPAGRCGVLVADVALKLASGHERRGPERSLLHRDVMVAVLCSARLVTPAAL